jgi:hypothetical protein
VLPVAPLSIGAVIRELEGELEVQQSEEYRARAANLSGVTELLRLVQEEMERSRQDHVGAGREGDDEGERVE